MGRTDGDERVLLELALELAAPGLDGVAVRVQKHFDWFHAHSEVCEGVLFESNGRVLVLQGDLALVGRERRADRHGGARKPMRAAGFEL